MSSNKVILHFPIEFDALYTDKGYRGSWPSLQVLRLNRKEDQILSWKPEAIGGRSGSSLIDYTDDPDRLLGDGWRYLR